MQLLPSLFDPRCKPAPGWAFPARCFSRNSGQEGCDAALFCLWPPKPAGVVVLFELRHRASVRPRADSRRWGRVARDLLGLSGGKPARDEVLPELWRRTWRYDAGSTGVRCTDDGATRATTWAAVARHAAPRTVRDAGADLTEPEGHDATGCSSWQRSARRSERDATASICAGQHDHVSALRHVDADGLRVLPAVRSAFECDRTDRSRCRCCTPASDHERTAGTAQRADRSACGHARRARRRRDSRRRDLRTGTSERGGITRTASGCRAAASADASVGGFVGNRRARQSRRLRRSALPARVR